MPVSTHERYRHEIMQWVLGQGLMIFVFQEVLGFLFVLRFGGKVIFGRQDQPLSISSKQSTQNENIY